MDEVLLVLIAMMPCSRIVGESHNFRGQRSGLDTESSMDLQVGMLQVLESQSIELQIRCLADLFY